MVYVYKAISPSNKVYIGITSNLKKRIARHKLNSKNPRFHFSIACAKYGFNTIKWEIIDVAKDYSVAHELERRYILHFDSYDNGYNSSLGGEGSPGNKQPIKWTKESILKEALKYSRRLDWHKNCGASYVQAKTFGDAFFEECCKHMKKLQKHWTSKTALKEAKKYNNVDSWKKASSGSLKFAIRSGPDFYAKCKSHMKLRKKNEAPN